MASYTINKVDGDTVFVTLKIDDVEYQQKLNSMPTAKVDFLKKKLESYTKDYETGINTVPKPDHEFVDPAVLAIVGQEIILP